MDEEVRTGDSKNERLRRIGLWLIGIGFFTVCVAYAVVQMMVPGKTALQQWMEEQRAEGERFTVGELFPQGFGDPTTNKIAEVERLLSMLDPRLYEMAGDSLIVASNGIATPVWQLPVTHRADGGATTNVPVPWSEWAEAVDNSALEWDEILRLLPIPDRDLGDAMRLGSTVKLDFVKKRQLAHQLAAMIMVELQRGNGQRAREAFDGFLRWPEWHAEYISTIVRMIRVALSGLLVKVQWSVLQYPGWSDADLLRWQQHWQTNVLVDGFPIMLRVERAMMFRQFDTLGQQGGTPLLWGRGTGTRFGDRVVGKIWSMFLIDADQLFYGKHLQDHIEVLRSGIGTEDYQSVAVETARLRAQLDLKIGSVHGRFYLVSRAAFPSFDRMF